VPVLAEVPRQIGLVMTDEKVVVEKRKRAHAFGNFRGTLAAAGKTFYSKKQFIMGQIAAKTYFRAICNDFLMNCHIFAALYSILMPF
jgi:hypothetical protein